jgi:hypothetical protein
MNNHYRLVLRVGFILRTVTEMRLAVFSGCSFLLKHRLILEHIFGDSILSVGSVIIISMSCSCRMDRLFVSEEGPIYL